MKKKIWPINNPIILRNFLKPTLSVSSLIEVNETTVDIKNIWKEKAGSSDGVLAPPECVIYRCELYGDIDN